MCPCLDALSPQLALDGLPCSLFKVMFPWWQKRVGEVVQPCLGVGNAIPILM